MNECIRMERSSSIYSRARTFLILSSRVLRQIHQLSLPVHQYNVTCQLLSDRTNNPGEGSVRAIKGSKETRERNEERR